MVSRRFPEWEEYPHTPAVFVRAANKELTAYVKWKSAEALENKGAIPERLKVGRFSSCNCDREHFQTFC
jgi:hypothetical protein